jgi:RNA polymerase sigma-70 factor (ECF subfamily)
MRRSVETIAVPVCRAVAPVPSSTAPTPYDDAALLLRLRQQHPEALEELARRYRSRILHRAARHVSSHADAEDLAQEVLIKVCQHVGRFGDTSLWPWIARITSNTAISLLRMRRLRALEECRSYADADGQPGNGLPPEPPDASRLADEMVFHTQLRCLLARALRDLPDAYRGAVLLRDLHGCTSAEASQRLRVPVPTVKSRVNRGRRLLKRALTAFQDGLQLHRCSAL